MTYKQFFKNVFAIAIPVALQNLLTTTGSMVDTIMIGSIGETSVGAVGLCAQYSSLMFSCYWGMLGGGTLFFSQYWGAKDDDGINRKYGLMTTTVVLISMIFAIGAIFFPQFVMSIYTDKPVYQEIGARYLRIAGFAYIPQIYSMAMACVMRSTEQVKIPLAASVISVCTNMLLNWVLIFGHLGAPKLGVEGAAIATVCAAVVNVLASLLLAKAVHFRYVFMISKHFRWTLASIQIFFKKCAPIIANEIAMGVANLIINMVLGRQAVEAIAALAVFRTIEGMVIAFFGGFSGASSVLVGNRVGAGEHEEAFWIANRVVYLCSGFILLVCIGIYALHTPLLGIMGLSGQSFEYAGSMLLVYCLIAALRMSNWISNDTGRASGDAVTGTVLEIVFMYVLNIPLICLAGLVWKLPFLLIFVFSYIDEPIRYVLMQFHMHSGGFIRPVTEVGRRTLPEFRANHPLKFFWTKIALKE